MHTPNNLSFRTVGLSASEAGDINTGIGIAAMAADSILPGVGTAISSVLSIITGIFTDQPCDPTEPCNFVPNWDGTGNEGAWKDCCMPPIVGTSVFLSIHAPGYKKWPQVWRNAYAADYYSIGNHTDQYKDVLASTYTPKAILDTYPTHPHPDFPNNWKERGLSTGMSPYSLSQIIIPKGFKVQLFDQLGCKGNKLELKEGAHNLHQPYKWGDKTASLKVRGPISHWDFWYGKALFDKTPGWFTANWPNQPTREEVFQLVLGDPGRINPPNFDQPMLGYVSFWGPGWETRIKDLEKRAPQAIQQVWQERGKQQRWWEQETPRRKPTRKPTRKPRRRKPTARKPRTSTRSRTESLLDQLENL
jgi:hypothetical protein